MAVDFVDENTANYYTVANDSSMYLPNADWAVGFWYRIEDNTGTVYQYPFSWGTIAANDSINFNLGETSNATSTRADNWAAWIQDNGGQLFANSGSNLLSPNDITTGSTNYLIVLTRSGTTCTMYTCAAGGTPTSEASATNGSFTTVSPTGSLYLGARNDLSATRMYEEHMGEVFIMHDTLSTDEITALASGVPLDRLNKDLRLWLDFQGAGATVRDLSGNGNDATRNGSPAASEHFPRLNLAPIYINAPAAAAGGTTILQLAGGGGLAGPSGLAGPGGLVG